MADTLSVETSLPGIWKPKWDQILGRGAQITIERVFWLKPVVWGSWISLNKHAQFRLTGFCWWREMSVSEITCVQGLPDPELWRVWSLALRGSKIYLWETLKQRKAVFGRPKSFREYSSKYSWGGMETIRLIPETSSLSPFSSLSPIQFPSPFLLPLPKSQLTHKPWQTQQGGRAHSGQPWPWGFFSQWVQFSSTEFSSNSVCLLILAITGAATLHDKIPVLLTHTHIHNYQTPVIVHPFTEKGPEVA